MQRELAPNFSWNILVVLFHYANFITDYLTLRNFWVQQQYYYFGALSISFSLSWFSCLLLIIKTKEELLVFRKRYMMLLWLFHLDYVIFALYRPKTHNRQAFQLYSNRKFITLMLQTIPAVFITVHSLFYNVISDIIPQISLAFSVLDFSFSNVWISEVRSQGDGVEPMAVNWKVIKRVILWSIFLNIENSSILIFWGFMTRFTRPYGAWIFFAVSYALLFLCFSYFSIRNRRVDYIRTFAVYFILILGRLNPEHNKTNADDESRALSLYKFLQLIGFGIVLYLHQGEMLQLLQQPFWKYYFWVGIGCVSIYLTMQFYIEVICSIERRPRLSQVKTPNPSLNESFVTNLELNQSVLQPSQSHSEPESESKSVQP